MDGDKDSYELNPPCPQRPQKRKGRNQEIVDRNNHAKFAAVSPPSVNTSSFTSPSSSPSQNSPQFHTPHSSSEKMSTTNDPNAEEELKDPLSMKKLMAALAAKVDAMNEKIDGLQIHVLNEKIDQVKNRQDDIVRGQTALSQECITKQNLSCELEKAMRGCQAAMKNDLLNELSRNSNEHVVKCYKMSAILAKSVYRNLALADQASCVIAFLPGAEQDVYTSRGAARDIIQYISAHVGKEEVAALTAALISCNIVRIRPKSTAAPFNYNNPGLVILKTTSRNLCQFVRGKLIFASNKYKEATALASGSTPHKPISIQPFFSAQFMEQKQALLARGKAFKTSFAPDVTQYRVDQSDMGPVLSVKVKGQRAGKEVHVWATVQPTKIYNTPQDLAHDTSKKIQVQDRSPAEFLGMDSKLVTSQKETMKVMLSDTKEPLTKVFKLCTDDPLLFIQNTSRAAIKQVKQVRHTPKVTPHGSDENMED